MIQDCELVTLGGERIALITVGGMRTRQRAGLLWRFIDAMALTDDKKATGKPADASNLESLKKTKR